MKPLVNSRVRARGLSLALLAASVFASTGCKHGDAPADRRIRGGGELARRGFAVGPEMPATTVVVFTDFQCPVCRSYSHLTDSVHEEFPDVRIVERHFPSA